jgi:N-acetyl-anhydromuramyl-L-alanine amidase AmpD
MINFFKVKTDMNFLNINQTSNFIDCYEPSNSSRDIRFVVLHHIQANSLDHALYQLHENKVSCHYLIDDNGNVFELINERDIAFHAGKSYWQGVDGLNKFSIGIELISNDPFLVGFSKAQMDACAELCRHLSKKYKITPRNFVGHSDVAYCADTLMLDRKQDPSHLFNWEFLANNDIGIFPKISINSNYDKIMFYPLDCSSDIFKIKNRLKIFGYRVNNFDNHFDEEMQILARVFNRRFNPSCYLKNSDSWYHSSQIILNKLVS